jgi:hypothetical protein
MHAPLDELLGKNYFDVLQVPPSLPYRSVRRRLDEMRMEADLGLSGVSAIDLTSASVALGTEERALEYRLLASWSEDPLLSPFAASHDHSIEGLRAIRRGSDVDPSAVAAGWLRSCSQPGLVEVMGGFAPRAMGWEKLRDEVLAEGLTPLTRPGSRKVKADHISLLLSHFSFDAVPLTRQLLESLLAESRDIERRTLDEWLPQDGKGTPEAAERAADWFLWAKREAASLQRLLKERSPAFSRQGPDWSTQLGETTARTAVNVSTALHNAHHFDLAEKVIAAALEMEHTPDDRERLTEDLQTVRLVAARARVSEALKAGDLAASREALAVIARLTDDQDERAQVADLLQGFEERGIGTSDPRLRGATAIRRAPPLWTWNGCGVRVVGGHDHQRGTYSGVYYLTLLWIPLLPLRRYRVREYGENGYQFLARLPLRTLDRWHLALGLLVIVAAVGGISAAVATSNDDDAVAGPSSTRTSPPQAPRAEEDLDVGDCVVLVGTEVDVVSCSTTESARVVGVGEISTASYPTDAQLQAQAERICPSTAESYLYPLYTGWLSGDRTLVCLDE